MKNFLFAMVLMMTNAHATGPKNLEDLMAATGLTKDQIVNFVSQGECSASITPTAKAARLTPISSLSANILDHFVAQKKGMENVILSPVALNNLLLLVASGSEGNTLQEFAQTMGLDFQSSQQAFQELAAASELMAQLEQSGVTTGQAAFFDQTFWVHDSYLNGIRSLGNSMVESFSSPEQLFSMANDWVSRQSRGLIPSLLSRPSQMDMLLASILTFKAKWRLPFDVAHTQAAAFTRVDGSVTKIQMMHIKNSFRYKNDSPVGEIVVLPFHGDLEAVFVLPPSGEKPGVVSQQALFRALRETFETKVSVYLPRVDVNFDSSLSDVLKSLGLLSVFDPRTANLTAMASGPAYVSEIFTKNRILWDEVGAEGASVVAARVMRGMSMEPTFKANRPFSFYITSTGHNVASKDQTVVFSGWIGQP